MKKQIRVGLIGAGLIGERRADIAAAGADTKMVAVCDTDTRRANALGKRLDCEVVEDGFKLAVRNDVDAVIVATPHKFLPVYARAAMKAGKHVLCEKPMGRNSREIQKLVETAKAEKVFLKGGFNHRYHPAIQKAHELVRKGAIGKIILIRCRYGHGGRPGYEREWRGNTDLAGGGELLDQGIHALDLFRWFAGDFIEAFGWVSTRVWDIAPLEDNAMALLKTPDGVQASLHASWTQWKNLFSFEIFGQEGYLTIEGLGGSYGPERLTVARRKPESGPPDVNQIDFPGPDTSWKKEWDDFVGAIRKGRKGGGEDGLAAMRLVDAIYQSARKNRPVRL